MFKKILMIISLSFLMLTACTAKVSDNQTLNETNNEKLKIATTFAPLYSFVTNITGDLAEVENLVPPGTSVHVWEPKASNLKAIAEADLLIMNGLELEPFIEDMISSAQNPNLTVVVTTDTMETFLMNTPEAFEIEEEDEHEEEHHHHHEGVDPHVWLDPELAIKQVELIRDAVVLADPEHQDVYKTNAEAYIGKLRALSEEISRQFEEAAGKDFIVFHDAYTYFLKRYGFLENRKASIEPFPGKEPTAAHFQGLVNLIEEQGVKIVFIEPQFSPRTVQNLQEQTGIKSFEINPIGLELSLDAYENNIRNLTQTFIKAFK